MKTVKKLVVSERQEFNSDIRTFLPQYVSIAFNQNGDADAEPCVKIGDTVTEGQLIACNKDENHISYIHSSVPGKVEGISKTTLPNGRLGDSFLIKLQGSFSYLGKPSNSEDWQSFSNDKILSRLRDCGVTNTFSGAKSIYSEIINNTKKDSKFVILRMFDEDPSRMTDLFISKNYRKEVIIGCCILAKVLEADGIVLVYPKNDSISYQSDSLKDFEILKVDVDTSFYPCGYKQNLVEIIKQTINDKKNFKTVLTHDFNKINKNDIFVDGQCALDVYKAVVYNESSVEKIVHITGNALRSAGMFKLRLGEPIINVIEQCGGFKYPPAKIIVNGILIGNDVTTTDIFITKAVKSIAFVPANDLHDQTGIECIRCGKCRDICPEGLFPDILCRHVSLNYKISDELIKTSILCSGCNLCNSVCPSRLSLSQCVGILRNRTNV